MYAFILILCVYPMKIICLLLHVSSVNLHNYLKVRIFKQCAFIQLFVYKYRGMLLLLLL